MRRLKQPAEQLVYEFDFAARLGELGTLAAIVAATVTPRGQVAVVTPLSIGAQAINGQKARLRLDGGTDGEVYAVVVRCSDNAGQTHDIDAEIAVVDFGFEVPSVTSSYLSAQAFVERLGLDDAIRLTDTIGTGRIEVARLATALADAQAEADLYLAARYATPLAIVPALIATIVFDLAVARLWRGELPESVRDRRDNAQAQLKAIAKGSVIVPGAEQLTATTAAETPVLYSGNERLFTRETMRDL